MSAQDGIMTKPARVAVRATELKCGDVLVSNEGTSLPVSRRTILEIKRTSQHIRVVTEERESPRRRSFTDLERDDVFSVERS